MDGKRRKNDSRRGGFTLLEMVCVLVLLGVVALLTTRMFTNLISGYTLARNSAAAVQKAQNALQRMTIDFTYLKVASSSGGETSISYNTSLDNDAIVISQSDNKISYSLNGTPYTLTDGVGADSLRFTYYNTYTSSADSALSSNTALVGISFTMVGDDPSQGFSQTYSTRVALNKVKN
ncbi:prepilin-type N-terminal cleavage/methylation domain-containing protein [Solidesulfovibrio sp. C21]|uniref:prepilin-type N-terminal cleavage/methylation domain-containing protein n=1 Tax=Solidesulfovibrio sp. C21 TaxID=3398613 RepID=UPI0039FC921B